MNSFTRVGLKVWVSVAESVVPGPFLRTTFESGKLKAAVVVP